MSISLKVTDKKTGEVIRFKVKDGTPKEKFPAAAKKALEVFHARKAAQAEAGTERGAEEQSDEPTPSTSESAPSQPSTPGRQFVCSVCRDVVKMDDLPEHVEDHQATLRVAVPGEPPPAKPESSSRRTSRRVTS